MKAIWLDQQPRLRTDLSVPSPSTGEALVRVRLAGVCSTDLALLDGYYPFTGVLGHEFVGEIVAAANAPERIGERVVGAINISCGQCRECLACRPNHCLNRAVLGIKRHHGAFADCLCLPLQNLYRVPDQVSDRAAVFTEPLAAALEIPEVTRIKPSDRVLLVGAGRLGQLIARVIALTGANLDVVARHAHQRQRLQGIASRCISEPEVAQGQYDLVVEASGAPSGFALARQALRPRGTLCLKSTYRGEVPVALSSLVVDEIRIIGSRCGPFPAALRLLEQQHIDPTPLIDCVEPLANGLVALQRAAEPSVLKALVDCR
ncbi:MAG: alcohol dehydrogenase catalytic domain-containing protein [Lamprobacter sp.]|uniref:MDR/zinc-dependent alcohol dehydrogenase-like family protein n=1 Tax=Lamprobacter sp. TaxID=3100796 RepID=UPI002B25DE63|nr:alcohol dehydrogenase catalytic domain-containing protein [Lamprobacter sp.]MEA3639374.1 alcohol dehydrogenase catalytic domain-containing protein [Lamprobacter sp.]